MSKISDIDELMYSCGLEILHPGGLEKTDEMVQLCRIGKNKSVLDIGSGKGATACCLAQKYDCRITGIDLSEKMIEYARQTARQKALADKVTFVKADACQLPFPDECFDIVLAECTTVLLDKERAFAEFLRLTKPDGYIADLEMTWRKTPPQAVIDHLADAWDNFATMTLQQWQSFFEKLGLVDIKTADFSDAIADMEKNMNQQLGFKGKIKLGVKLLCHPRLLPAMRLSAKIFHDYADYIGYGYIIGRKK